MYKLQENSVLRLSDNASVPMVDGNTEYEEYKQWLAEGNTPEPQYTAEELLAKLKAEISSAIQSMLDTKAVELRWDDMKSARAAAGIPLPADASAIEQAILDEAIKLSQWYLKCWAKASELEALGTVMTVEEVLAQMPVYVP